MRQVCLYKKHLKQSCNGKAQLKCPYCAKRVGVILPVHKIFCKYCRKEAIVYNAWEGGKS